MNSLVSKVAPLAVGSIALGGFVVSRPQPIMLEGELKRERLPIYPQAQPQIILVEESSALNSHIAAGREATTSVIQDIRERTQAVVSRVVSGERKVVNKVDSLIPKDEPLNPGLLWVLVSTLSGSIIARNRIITTRFLLPPTIFLIALPTFLPKLSSNLSTEISTQTAHYAPELHKTLSEYRSSLLDKTEDTRDWLQETQLSLGKHLGAGVQTLEDKSGLQLAQAWRNQASSSSSSSRPEHQIVVSREAGREVTVPLYDQHSSKQVIPGTNTVVSNTTSNSHPTEVLSVPVYKQVGGPLSTKEKVDQVAAKGLEVLERKGQEVLGSAEERAAEAKAAGLEKLREGKELVKEAEQAIEKKVERVEERVKAEAKKPESKELKVDEVLINKDGKKVEEVKLVSGYKKLV